MFFLPATLVNLSDTFNCRVGFCVFCITYVPEYKSLGEFSFTLPNDLYLGTEGVESSVKNFAKCSWLRIYAVSACGEA